MKVVLAACPRIEAGTLKLSLGYLKAYSKNSDHKVVCFDFDNLVQTEPQPSDYEQMVEMILSEHPDMVGFSLYRHSLDNSQELVRRLKEITSSTWIVYGGPELNNPYCRNRPDLLADFLVLGEGEETFVELLSAIETNQNLLAVQGLGIAKAAFGRLGLTCREIPPLKAYSYKDTEIYHFTGFRPPMKNMDALPLPDFSDFDLENYIPDISIMFGRGCTGSCSFCVEMNCLGSGYRHRSPANIIEEISHYYALGKNHFYVRDSAVNAKVKVLEQLCDLILARGYQLSMTGNAQLKESMIPILPKMKKAGFHKLQYGLESASTPVLKDMRKKSDVQAIQRIIHATSEAGIQVMIYIILCYPTETEDDFSNTLDFIWQNAAFIDDLYVSLCGIIPEDPYGIEQYISTQQSKYGIMWNEIYWYNANINEEIRKIRVQKFYQMIEKIKHKLHREFPSVISAFNGLDRYRSAASVLTRDILFDENTTSVKPACPAHPLSLDELCCPACGEGGRLQEAAITSSTNGAGYRCCLCQAEFPVLGGIPLMWRSDADCVRDWGHRYKDFILDESTIEKWGQATEDSFKEGAVWNRLQTYKKWLRGRIIPVLIISSMLIILSAIIFRTPWLYFPAGICFLVIITLWWIYWDCAVRHLYLCRSNHFIRQTKLIGKLLQEDQLSERKHFGGGETAFLNPIPEEALVPPSRTDREREQYAFVSRKADYVMRRLRRYVRPEVMKQWRVLCLGCGGPSHQGINRVFADAGCSLVGIDTQDFNVAAFHHIFHAPAILANAMRIPLKRNLFDCVVFTDVLEHLHDPLAGLKEIHRVLKPGGVLVMTTNNLAHHRHVVNPAAFLKVWLGQWFPRLLPCRDTTSDWDGKLFYHNEYARKEIVELFSLAGFLKPSITTSNIASSEDSTQSRRIKFLRLLGLGEEFFIIGRKGR